MFIDQRDKQIHQSPRGATCVEAERGKRGKARG